VVRGHGYSSMSTFRGHVAYHLTIVQNHGRDHSQASLWFGAYASRYSYIMILPDSLGTCARDKLNISTKEY